jgi:hypothetical protein
MRTHVRLLLGGSDRSSKITGKTFFQYLFLLSGYLNKLAGTEFELSLPMKSAGY